MFMLGDIEVNGYTMIIVAMAAVLIMIAGICWYTWHDGARSKSFRLHKEREQTHREIAAYVAEGTISPGDAERMIAAMGAVPTQEQFARVRQQVDAVRMRG